MDANVAYYYGDLATQQTTRVFYLNTLALFSQSTETIDGETVSELTNADGDVLLRGSHADVSALWEKVVWPIVDTVGKAPADGSREPIKG